MNFEASPLSLYYFRVGHSRELSPTTRACFRWPEGSYLLRISRYFRWLLKDFYDFYFFITWQLVDTSLFTNFEFAFWILKLLNFSKLSCLWITLFGLWSSGLLSRRLRLVNSMDRARELLGDWHRLPSSPSTFYILLHIYIVELWFVGLRVLERLTEAFGISKICTHAGLNIPLISLVVGLILEHQEFECLVVGAVVGQVRHQGWNK